MRCEFRDLTVTVTDEYIAWRAEAYCLKRAAQLRLGETRNSNLCLVIVGTIFVWYINLTLILLNISVWYTYIYLA